MALINCEINLILTWSVNCVIRSTTVFKIPKYLQNEPRFKNVFSGNNLPEIQNGTYVTNLDEYKSVGTHWVALYVNGQNVTYFNSFGVKHIPIEIKKFIGNKNIVYFILSYCIY